MQIKCPCCGNMIKLETYYSSNREKILNKYKEKMKDPAFVERRRKIALKSYYKRKGK